MFSSSNPFLNPSYQASTNTLAKKPKTSTLAVKSKRFNMMIPSFRSYFEFYAQKPTKPLISQILPNYSINDYLPNKTLSNLPTNKSFIHYSRAQYGPETTRLLQDSIDSVSDTENPFTDYQNYLKTSTQKCFTNAATQTLMEEQDSEMEGSILSIKEMKDNFDATFKPRLKELDDLLATSQFGDRKKSDHKVSNETDMSNINLVTESTSADNRGKLPYRLPSKLNSFITELKNPLLNEQSKEDAKSEDYELIEKRQVKCEVEDKNHAAFIQSFRPLDIGESRFSGLHCERQIVGNSVAKTASFNGSTRNSCSNEKRKIERYSQRTKFNKLYHPTQFSAIEEETNELSKLETSKVSMNHTKLGSEANETLNLLSKLKEDSVNHTSITPHTSFENIPLTDMTTDSINKLMRYETKDLSNKNLTYLEHNLSIGMSGSIKTIPELLYSTDNEKNIHPSL